MQVHVHRRRRRLPGATLRTNRRATPLSARDPLGYAIALHRYADGRVEPHALHSWLVWRLMADRRLGHEQALLVADAATAGERDAVRLVA